MTLRVATVQGESTPGAVDQNLEKVSHFIRLAAADSAELIVFPEAFVTGYEDSIFAGELPTLEDVGWLARVQRTIDVSGAVVVLNTALDRGGRRTLTDLVLRPHRPLIAAYDKQHLYENERSYFAAGSQGFSFTLKRTRVALSVCYDANFPEHAAAAAADGATVYINSGAYYPGGATRRDLHHAARALDIGIYVVFSGLVGAPSDFIGGSAIFDPVGRQLASVSAVEGIAVADLLPDVAVAARSQQRMWADRHVHLGEYAHTDFDAPSPQG